MGNAYACDLNIMNSNDDGTIGPRRVVCIHTWEGDWSARKMGEYHQHNQSGSYHITIDKNGVTNRENDDEFVTWSAMYTGNRVCYHVCLAGFARWGRADWLSRRKQMEALARVLWAFHTTYGIPLRKIDGKALRDGAYGICGHIDISEAWSETDHWDPGYNLPYDVVLQMARSFGGKPSKEKEVGVLSYGKRIFEQLAGIGKGKNLYPGWPQLGDRTLVDAIAAIGDKLEIDGFKAPKKG